MQESQGARSAGPACERDALPLPANCDGPGRRDHSEAWDDQTGDSAPLRPSAQSLRHSPDDTAARPVSGCNSKRPRPHPDLGGASRRGQVGPWLAGDGDFRRLTWPETDKRGASVISSSERADSVRPRTATQIESPIF